PAPETRISSRAISPLSQPRAGGDPGSLVRLERTGYHRLRHPLRLSRQRIGRECAKIPFQACGVGVAWSAADQSNPSGSSVHTLLIAVRMIWCVGLLDDLRRK